jgi:HK97 family phage major capsid protein
MKTTADEIRDLTDHATALIRAAQGEDRELTDDESKQLDGWRGEIEALEAKQAARSRTQGLLEQFAKRAVPAATNGRPALVPGPNAAPAPLVSGPGPEARSLGAQFVEHEGYKGAIHGVQRSGRWQSPTFEIQAAGVTLVPAGSAIPPGTMSPMPFTFPAEWSVAVRFAPGTTDAGLVPYLRETVWTNAAAVVAMGAVKPQSTKEFTLVQQALIKIAHYIDCPDELLDDIEGLRSFIDAQMALGVLEKLETDIISGPGTAGQMQGLLTLPGKAPDIAYTAGQPYITPIIAQRAQVYELSRLRPDTVVLSPSTWALVSTQTTTGGGFLLGPGVVVGPVPSIWGMGVVESPSVPDGTAIVGAFRQGGQLFRKGGIIVQATNSHAANFASNITTIRAELRVALAIYRSTAFGLVTGLVAA